MSDDEGRAFDDSDEETEKRKRQRKSNDKKKVKGPAAFIDDIASEDSDDDDDEIKEKLDTKSDKLKQKMIQDIEERRKNRLQFDSQSDVATYAERLEAKYREERNKTSSSTDTFTGPSSIGTLLLLRDRPTPNDPKLFVVKCHGGEENELVIKMYQKYIRDRHKKPTAANSTQPVMKSRYRPTTAEGAELEIFSVLAPTSSSGFMYVEAMKKESVEAAIRGVQGIFKSKISIVPVEQMTDVLKVDIRKDVIRKNDFVRMKGPHPYKGDLAQVYFVQDAGNRATVRLLPRIDFSSMTSVQSNKSTTNSATSTSSKSLMIPPAKFFIADEVRALGGVCSRNTFPLTGAACDEFDSHFFENGLMFLDVPMRQLTLVNANQYSPEEAAVFHTVVGSEGDAAAAAAVPMQRRVLVGKTRRFDDFSVGDVVLIVSGTDSGLEGVIEQINLLKGIASIQTKQVAQPVEVRLEDLVKVFKVGDAVVVTNNGGEHVGKTGNVVYIFPHQTSSPPKVLMMTDGGGEEIQVFNSDLKISNGDAGLGQKSLLGVVLYDLVLLDQNLAAIIVRVGSHTLRVLTQSGDVKEINPTAIRSRRNQASKEAVIVDRNSQRLSLNDPIAVISGPHMNRTGTIKQIHAKLLFVYDTKREGENAGIVVVKASDCRLLGNKVSSTLKMDRPSSTSQFAPKGKRDEMIGKQVRIRKGDDKGLIGTVVDGGSFDIVRVELNSRNRVIGVKREHVVIVEPEETTTTTTNNNYYNPHNGGNHYSEANNHGYSSFQPVPGTPMESHRAATTTTTTTTVATPATTTSAASFNRGDSVKLMDTGESVTVYSVVDSRDVVVQTSRGEFKIVNASNLVYA